MFFDGANPLITIFVFQNEMTGTTIGTGTETKSLRRHRNIYKTSNSYNRTKKEKAHKRSPKNHTLSLNIYLDTLV